MRRFDKDNDWSLRLGEAIIDDYIAVFGYASPSLDRVWGGEKNYTSDYIQLRMDFCYLVDQCIL